MVLCAGRGTRMGALSRQMPKPLVSVAGRSVFDRIVDDLKAAGIERLAVNVHHLADRMEAAARARSDVQISICDERDRLRDTGGGVMHARDCLTTTPFLVRNGDALWLGEAGAGIADLLSAFQAETMDACLLLVGPEKTVGHAGGGDFHLGPGGRVRFAKGEAGAPVYTGTQAVHPRLLAAAPGEDVFSFRHFWQVAAERGRLYGVTLDATWLHIGDPQALALAERALQETAA